MRRRCLVLFLPIVTGGAGSLAAVTSSLRVERDERVAQCDDRDQLAQRVAATLGRAVPFEDAPGRNGELGIVVAFSRDGDTLVARVSASGPKPGVRTLRDAGPSCEGLSEAVGVAIALLMDDREQRVEQSDATTPGNVGPAPPAASGRTAVDREPGAQSAPTTRRWQARVALGAAASYGLGGDRTWLGAGRLGARETSWVFDVGLAASLPVREAFDAGSVQTSLWFGVARGCYLVAAGGAFEVGPCAQLGVGRLRGAGEDFGETRRASLPWTAVSLGLGAERPLGSRWFLTVEGSLWLPLEEHTFSVQNRGIAWESKPLAGVLAAGVGWRAF